MQDISRRLEALEKEIEKRNGGFFTIYYKDGTTKKIEIGQVILFCLCEESEKIERFEEGESCNNDGILEGLANALLIKGD